MNPIVEQIADESDTKTKRADSEDEDEGDEAFGRSGE